MKELFSRNQTLQVRFEHMRANVQNEGTEYTQDDIDDFTVNGQRTLDLLKAWMADVYAFMQEHRKKE